MSKEKVKAGLIGSYVYCWDEEAGVMRHVPVKTPVVIIRSK